MQPRRTRPNIRYTTVLPVIHHREYRGGRDAVHCSMRQNAGDSEALSPRNAAAHDTNA